ncbi:MAG: hypothetical protein ACJ0BQ_00385 [Coraliomargaritaceae bacterium]
MKKSTPYLFLITSLILVSCYSSKSVDNDIPLEQTINSELLNTQISASIMHVDLVERIVTLKSNTALEPGFYVLSNKNGDVSSAIKLSQNSYSSIYEADILEGRPRINDIVSLASTEEVKSLSKKYSDPKVD